MLPDGREQRAAVSAAVAVEVTRAMAEARKELTRALRAGRTDQAVGRVFDKLQRRLELNLERGITTTVTEVRAVIDAAVLAETSDYPVVTPGRAVRMILAGSLGSFVRVRSLIARAERSVYRIMSSDAVEDVATEVSRVMDGGRSVEPRTADLTKLGANVTATSTNAVITSAYTSQIQALTAAPMVRAVQRKLNLVRRSQTKPDECDIIAKQDFYGLGDGVFPVTKVPNYVHPNDLCWLFAITRPESEWGDPKPDPALQRLADGKGVESLSPAMRKRAIVRANRAILASTHAEG